MSEPADRHLCIEVVEISDDTDVLALHVVGVGPEEAVAILRAALRQLEADLRDAKARLN